MSTPVIKDRHRAVVKELHRQAITHDFKPISDTLEEFGHYSHKVARHAQKTIMQSPSMQLALKEEGISTENADNVVKSILNTKTVYEMITPDNQLRAADMIYKRLGAYAPEKLEVRKVVANIVFNKPNELKKEIDSK